MSKYTLETRQISNILKENVIFNFEYDFYDNGAKCKFEEKFIDEYFFDEIGFETVERFRLRLKSKLNRIAPYYRQLYETELASNGIDFLLNKDLTITEERDNDKTAKGETSGNGKTESSGSSKSSTIDNSKASNIDDGVATLTEDNLTSISIDDSKNEGSDNSKTDNTSTSKSETTDNEKETITRIEKGNIGVTSSAELLAKWRTVLINIDSLIIDECRTLFMLIY